MTNSILKPQRRLNIENRAQVNTLRGLIGLVRRSVRKMEKRYIQLNTISKEHFDVIIRMEAEEHLVPQNKMLSIGRELLSRIENSLESSTHNINIEEELIQQYIDELDIMNFMDFEVTKKYFSFIHMHFIPRIVQLRPMAA